MPSSVQRALEPFDFLSGAGDSMTEELRKRRVLGVGGFSERAVEILKVRESCWMQERAERVEEEDATARRKKSSEGRFWYNTASLAASTDLPY